MANILDPVKNTKNLKSLPTNSLHRGPHKTTSGPHVDHHRNVPKHCFTIISVFRWNSCGLSECLCSQQGQTLRKFCRAPTLHSIL